jgi:HAE1 family hydrophobic/amphiphilic exporter-1
VYRARPSEGEREGRLFVHLVQDGPMDRTEVMEAAKEVMPDDLPGVETTIGWEGSFDGGGDHQLGLSVFGEDMATLRGIAEELKRRVSTVQGVIGAHVDLDSEGADEVRLVVDREAAARYGVTARQIGNLVAYAMRGTRLPEVRDGDREVEVVARFALDDRSDLDDLLDLDLWSPAMNDLVPLRAVVDTEVGKGPGTIVRRDRQTSTGVTVDLADGEEPLEVLPRIEAALADLELPTGYGWRPGDEREQRAEEDAAIQLAMLLSITFVFLLIGVLFESWLLPLAVITTIPMAGMGAVWGLFLTGTDLDAMAFVGMVILVGVVVNNGIVLVDLVTQLRAEGVPRDEALVQAGRRRLRPILLTALTTIVGLVPMALGSSSFVGIPYAPLGRTVIFGMIAGTLLTLLFVPFLYALLDDLRAEWARLVAWVRA